jgi:hypothetical protein
LRINSKVAKTELLGAERTTDFTETIKSHSSMSSMHLFDKPYNYIFIMQLMRTRQGIAITSPYFLRRNDYAKLSQSSHKSAQEYKAAPAQPESPYE